MSLDDAKKASADAREALADALDQLEDKVNIPKKIGRLSKQASDSFEENPIPFYIAGAAAAAAVIGGIVWAIARRG